METPPQPSREDMLDAVSQDLEPADIEGMLNEYQRDGWETGDSCPNCGAEPTSRNLVMDIDSDEIDVAVEPARVICGDCDTVLYEHPKWRVYDILEDTSPYLPME